MDKFSQYRAWVEETIERISKLITPTMQEEWKEKYKKIFSKDDNK